MTDEKTAQLVAVVEEGYFGGMPYSGGSASFQCRGELRPVGSLPALDLRVFTQQFPPAAIQIVGDGFALRL